MSSAHDFDGITGGSGAGSRGSSASIHPFTLTFPNGVERPAVRAAHADDPAAIVNALGIIPSGPAVAVMGGAGLMTDESLAASRRMIEDGLCAFAEAHRATIVDGGTTAGVMGLLGMARRQRGYTFALVGVVPETKIELPGTINPDKEAELDAGHSHFVLVKGAGWGDESKLLAAVAAAAGVSQGPHPAIIGAIINGGEVVAAEAYARATGTLQFPLLVFAGSGRFADALAAAYRAGHSDDTRMQAILEQGTIFVRSVYDDPADLCRWLEEFFGLPRQSGAR